MWTPALAVALLGASFVAGQLTESVGPTTAASAKRTKICSVLDYGGSIGSSDIGERQVVNALHDVNTHGHYPLSQDLLF